MELSKYTWIYLVLIKSHPAIPRLGASRVRCIEFELVLTGFHLLMQARGMLPQDISSTVVKPSREHFHCDKIQINEPYATYV